MRKLIQLGLCLILCASIVPLIAVKASPSTQGICTGKASLTAQWYDRKIVSGDRTRLYKLYVSPHYQPTQATPLVLSLHGFSSNPTDQAAYAQWDKIADQEPLIVVYPQGTGFPLRWNQRQAFNNSDVDDVQFIRDLINTLSDEFCIDAARIYANGFSNGGGMTNLLACELSEQIAAVGMVAGAFSPIPEGCHPTHPMPIIAFHGTTDPIVAFKGNAEQNFPAIKDWAQAWAVRNGCQPQLKIQTLPAKVELLQYQGCAQSADVQLYVIEDMGHAWPGSEHTVPAFIVGNSSMAVDATQLMWEFFTLHPLLNTNPEQTATAPTS